MKIRSSLPLILALHMAAMAPAIAADWDSDTARLLGDPSYLPLAGQIEGAFESTYSQDRYDYQAHLPGGAIDTYKRTGTSFLPSLRYGITDDISVFADLGWGNNFNRENYTYDRFVFTPPPFHVVQVHATAKYHALGADDPVFGATWRVIDQRDAPVSVDITGTYSPDIFQSRVAGIRQTGTIATGGQDGTVQAAISREMQRLTVRAYGTFAYEGRRNERGVGGYEDFRSAPHPSYEAGVASELRLLPFLSLQAGLNVQKSPQFDRSNLTVFDVTPVTIKPGTVVNPYAGVVIPLLDRRVTAEIFYNHEFVGDETHSAPYDQVSIYTKQNTDSVMAQLRFVLGGAPAAPMPAPAPPPQAAMPSVPASRTYLVFFDWDRADLSARARAIVAEAAQASAHEQPARISVNGYTDLSGGARYNLALSLRRARSVEMELIRDGVSRSLIGIHGFGESNPLVATAAGVREPQNRRVEIIQD